MPKNIFPEIFGS